MCPAGEMLLRLDKAVQRSSVRSMLIQRWADEWSVHLETLQADDPQWHGSDLSSLLTAALEILDPTESCTVGESTRDGAVMRPARDFLNEVDRLAVLAPALTWGLSCANRLIVPSGEVWEVVAYGPRIEGSWGGGSWYECLRLLRGAVSDSSSPERGRDSP